MNNHINFLPGNPNNLLMSKSGSYDPVVNSMGYRAPEFDTVDWANSIVIFGCSQVYGTAISNEQTIANQLEILLKRPVINMGVPASSIAFSFANQLVLAENNIQPYAVVNCWTSTKRLSYFIDSDVITHLGPWADTANNQNLNLRLYKKMFECWNFNDSNPDIYSSIFQRMSKILWKDITHLEYSFFKSTADLLNVPLLEKIDLGLDESHPGPLTAFKTAEIIAQDL